MVRPPRKIRSPRLLRTAPSDGKFFAVTWSGLFTYAKLATFLGLVWGHARQNIFTETAAYRKHPTAKVLSDVFGLSHTRTSVLFLAFVGAWKIKSLRQMPPRGENRK